MNRELKDMRQNYDLASLSMKDSPEDPEILFDQWLGDAVKVQIPEPNAMVLSTVDSKGIPEARTVLLKEIEDGGFVFYTNYGSAKAREMAKNPVVSLLFLWLPLHRQVRITGKATKISRKQSEAYFQTRPRGNQIGAWVSPQSEVITSKEALETKRKEVEKKFEGIDPLPLPDFWGGYIVEPQVMEFWQGRPDRLHDRIRYRKQHGKWKKELLAP